MSKKGKTLVEVFSAESRSIMEDRTRRQMELQDLILAKAHAERANSMWQPPQVSAVISGISYAIEDWESVIREEAKYE